MAAPLAPRYFYECPECDQLHPLGWAGACADDPKRDAGMILTQPGVYLLDQDAPQPPPGLVPRHGVEYGCGVWACTDCYEPAPRVKGGR